jgi:hypothetical protein
MTNLNLHFPHMFDSFRVHFVSLTLVIRGNELSVVRCRANTAAKSRNLVTKKSAERREGAIVPGHDDGG